MLAGATLPISCGARSPPVAKGRCTELPQDKTRLEPVYEEGGASAGPDGAPLR